jgi:Carboxypeptidase regulatory-like domain
MRAGVVRDRAIDAVSARIAARVDASMSLLLFLALASPAPPTYGIAGQVISAKTGGPIEGALVVVECTCLDGDRETFTDANGRYRFRALPAGAYMVTVLHAHDIVAKTLSLGPRAARR